MIKRLDKRMLIEFSETETGSISWRIILTDKASRDIHLNSLLLNKIKRYEQEFKDRPTP